MNNKKTKSTSKTKKTKKQTSNVKLKDLKQEIDILKEKNLRILAEFENYKKRTNQNIEESFSRNIKTIISSFLPIFDDLDRISKNSDIEDIKILIDSINMINEKIIKILNDFNVSSFNSLGENFDSDYHEAIMMQESKEKENIIINEFEKGYKIKDRIIRHAKVIVSKGNKWEIIMKF